MEQCQEQLDDKIFEIDKLNQLINCKDIKIKELRNEVRKQNNQINEINDQF